MPYTEMHPRTLNSAMYGFLDVNDVLSLCSMFAAKAQDLVVWNRQNPPYSTRVGWLYWWGELLSMTCLIISCRYYSSSY